MESGNPQLFKNKTLHSFLEINYPYHFAYKNIKLR